MPIPTSSCPGNQYTGPQCTCLTAMHKQRPTIPINTGAKQQQELRFHWVTTGHPPQPPSTPRPPAWGEEIRRWTSAGRLRDAQHVLPKGPQLPFADFQTYSEARPPVSGCPWPRPPALPPPPTSTVRPTSTTSQHRPCQRARRSGTHFTILPATRGESATHQSQRRFGNFQKLTGFPV